MAELGASRLENVVEYKIFIIHLDAVENKEPMTSEDIFYNVLSYAQSIIGDYIWQNDCFNLTCQELEKSKEMEHSEKIKFLKGSSNFGDNMQDEWFIVYLLFSITKQFPQLAATVNDNDGEFLLIEAAEYLPKWLEPNTSENRVFIYQGNLHIIPLPSKPSEVTVFPTGTPTIYHALKILKIYSEKTLALPWIRDHITKKIQEYPKKARECFHHVLCYVPQKVKYLLETKKSLISPAVLAFVNQDPADMKTCQKLTHFTLESRVPCRIRFTKCLYGQLVKQDFIPGKFAIQSLPEVSSHAYKGHLVGLKLTYGFEILYNQQSSYTSGVTTSHTASSQQWEKYLNSLTKYGYFQNQVVGSQLYTQLLKNAKEHFTRICMSPDQDWNNSTEMKQLLEEMPEPEKLSDKPGEFPPDDDESWLEVSREELDSILSQYGQTDSTAGSDVDLKEVVNGMNSFVQTMSSYEGAEFPSQIKDEPDIQFDPEGFMTSLDKFFTKPTNGIENGASSDDNNSDANDDEEIQAYISAMDRELSSSNIGKSFVKLQEKTEELETSNNKDESPHPTTDDAMKPVDIDLNLVQNFLESYSLQEGLPGPVSNILGSMGIKLPENQSQTNP